MGVEGKRGLLREGGDDDDNVMQNGQQHDLRSATAAHVETSCPSPIFVPHSVWFEKPSILQLCLLLSSTNHTCELFLCTRGTFLSPIVRLTRQQQRSHTTSSTTVLCIILRQPGAIVSATAAAIFIAKQFFPPPKSSSPLRLANLCRCFSPSLTAMSWMWSTPPPDDEPVNPDPYASAFEQSSSSPNSAFGSAFSDDIDITPPTSSHQSADPLLSSDHSASSLSPYALPPSHSSSYSSSSSPSSSNDPSSPPSLDFGTLSRINPSVVAPGGLARPSVDYVFADDYKDVRKKSPAEQLTFLAGSAYLLGTAVGSALGLSEALPASRGKPARLRLNAALNAVAKRGAGLGNSAGVLALAFSLSETVIYNYTSDETVVNYAAAGAMAGALFKSTRGLRVAGVWGAGGAAVALATVYATRQGYYGRGLQGIL